MPTREEVQAWIDGGYNGPDPRGQCPPGHNYYYNYIIQSWTVYERNTNTIQCTNIPN